MKRLLLLLLVFMVADAARAAGPAGHFLLGQKTIQLVRGGNVPAPDELKRLLSDPECRRAYSGGAVGPDICEEASHYGDTGALANRLLVAARERARAAAARGDREAFQQAKREMAFAYGWQNHFAADLDIHPVVNGQVGDTFRHLDKGGKLAHGLREAQLTAYLQQVIGKQKYDVAIPFTFLAEVTGIPEAKLRQGAGVVNGKTAGELLSASKVTLTREQLRAIWGAAVTHALRQTEAFHRAPSEMRNWDLDCGRISTAEFEALRGEIKELNGGMLPKNWGRDYLKWHALVNGLPAAERRAKLEALLERKPAPVPGSAPSSALAVQVWEALRGCDLMDLGAYGHITETGSESRSYSENIGAVSSSTIDPLDAQARVCWSGNAFSVVAEGEDTIYGGRLRRGRIKIEGSVSADGKTASAHAESYTIETGSHDYSVVVDLVNVPLDVDYFRENRHEPRVRFLVKGTKAPGTATRAETVFRYLNSDGTVKENGTIRRTMDFRGTNGDPQVAIYFARRR